MSRQGPQDDLLVTPVPLFLEQWIGAVAPDHQSDPNVLERRGPNGAFHVAVSSEGWKGLRDG